MFGIDIPLLDNFVGGLFDGDMNPLSGLGGLFGNDNGSPWESLNSPDSWWDNFKNGQTNEVNKEIADENLNYQRERNEIEDARYEDETSYNRQWNEEQRAYERALQQQIFDREDTALERQASSLSKMGINPLGQNMQGLGAGQAVTATPSATPSTRGGTALHNDFQMQDSGMLSVLSTLGSLYQGLEGVITNREQRDSIRLENDKKRIDNMTKLFDLGFDVKDFDQLALENPYVLDAKGAFWKGKYHDLADKEFTWKGKRLNYDISNRDFNEMKSRGLYSFDPDFIKNTKYFASDDFQDLFEKILTRGTAMADSLYQKFTSGKQDKETSKIKKIFDFLF